jgi:hypothetical protein
MFAMVTKWVRVKADRSNNPCGALISVRRPTGLLSVLSEELA